MKKTVFIAAHPDFNNSVTTRNVTEFILSKPEAGNGIIDVRILSALYPDYRINVKAEQQALLNAENIVLQFPFYWYNVPAILKLWLDDVLEYGFAYGKTGDKLKGKNLLLSLSTGGPMEAYQPEGRNKAYVEDYLAPMKQTAFLTQTVFLKPLISYGMPNIKGLETDKNPYTEKAIQHAEKLYEFLKII